MEGFTSIDRVKVTYELLGRTQHDTILLIAPIVLTECRLNRLPNGC
jgi:hypothetical protein